MVKGKTEGEISKRIKEEIRNIKDIHLRLPKKYTKTRERLEKAVDELELSLRGDEK